MIAKFLIGLAAAACLFLIIAALQPKKFHVERSAKIAVTPLVVFEQVNDHRKFVVWSPWVKMDPEVKNTFSGPDFGVASVCAWEGKKVGVGSATIIESKPGELVRLRMDWAKPLKGTSTVDFTFKPDGSGTLVTWAMYGDNNFLGKIFSLFMNCEKMCGPEFEKGLADLGTIVTTPFY